jgi:RNA 3'-terminal phosphate cyclase (ATP)
LTRFLEIDGSFGEGGGQTVRIATSFSIILNQPIRVINVRSARKVPGLRPQHAATLRILRDICGGSLEGGNVGSTEFTFTPGALENISPASLDLGTAGSITLVLQALVPAVALSEASLELELIGGTDVPWSPTSDYIGAVLGQCLRRIGIRFSFEVSRRGYYPRGGGRASVRIEPCAEVSPLQLTSRGRGPPPPISIVSRAGSLPRHVAERQAAAAASALARSGLRARTTTVYSEESLSPGSSILISCVGETCYIGSDSIGARGKPAERVGSEAAAQFVRTYASPACVDANLADMVAPLLCLAQGPSSLVTSQATGHLRTSLQVATQFVQAGCTVTALEAGGALVSIEPGSKIANKVSGTAGSVT